MTYLNRGCLVHLADRAAFLLALHVQFHEHLRDRIQQVVATLPPGAERLCKSVEVYLDECLKERALKALLLDARSQAPLTEAMQQRQREFATLTSIDFQVLGWPDAKRLFTVLVAEVALVELETGHNEAMRQTLWNFARIEHA